MLTMCPKCFGLADQAHKKKCTSCKATNIKVHEDIENVVIDLLLLGFKVSYADCCTYEMYDGNPEVKATTINIIFWYDYPESLFESLPTGWILTHGVTDLSVSNGMEISYTGLYPAEEYDSFRQWCARLDIIGELEAWVATLDGDGVKAVLKLGGYEAGQ